MQLGASSDSNPPTASFLCSLGAAVGQVFLQRVLSDTIVAVSLSTRTYGCVATVAEPISPCSFSAFATAIVNHAAPGPEEPGRLGVNSGRSTGNPLGTVSTDCPTIVACCSHFPSG